MTVNTRYTQDRLEQKLSKALAYATGGRVEHEYEIAAKAVADTISDRIRASGRGGEHNAEFAEQQTRVFQARSGRYNILLGWLAPPASAHEKGGGGRLWYQYQDSGFHLFGGPNWIEGVNATNDRRAMLIEQVEAINRKYVHDIANILER
jgi:hypothetical protein